MSLEILKEGLSKTEKANITRTFNKRVNEEVKLQVTAVVEGELKDLFTGLKSKYDGLLKDTFEEVKDKTLTEVKGVDKDISKYITYFISETVPGQVVETVQKGLRYSNFLDKIYEETKAEAKLEAVSDVNKEIKSLTEKLDVSEEKRKNLFERMVEDANEKVIHDKKAKFEEELGEYPDAQADLMRKLITETIDFASIETKNIKKKVERIAGAVKKTAQRRDNQLNEDTSPGSKTDDPMGRGNVLRPQGPDDEVHEDVAFTLDWMDRTSPQ